MPPILPALATALALLLYVVLGFNVGRARGRYNVAAPATSGHPAFERIYRVQQNTLEQIVFFLPALWLFSLFVSPVWGGGLGFVWILGRVYYAWSYYRDPAKRGPGFAVGLASGLILLIGAIVGMLRSF